VLAAHGFAVPATLITTDAEAARRFWTEHGAVIYKSMSGVRSIVTRLTPETDARLDDVQYCPTQFQQYVPGWDVRVHVVGDRTFACEVLSVADDYRYAGREGATTQLRPCTLPDEVIARCQAVCRALALPVAGVDLRRTPDRRWFAFEVNPSPGFSYYEAETGQPIARAIADYLAEGG
jgi:glutathione synthase/RimK-type ligase-like ATP-grasp enzyme